MIYRKDINGLRGISVLMVVIYHYNKYILKAGFVGVDVFFFISGYIMYMVYSSRYKNIKRLLVDFYLNRIKRILPISFLVLFYVIINIKLFNKHNPADIQEDIRYAVLGISNIRFYNKNIDYVYENEPPSIILHFWSLSIEEQFYCIFPIFIFMNEILLFLLMCISLVYSIFASNDYKHLSYFIFKVRIWEFLSGIYTFSITNDIRIRDNYFNVLSYIGIFIYLLFSMVFEKRADYPSFYPILVFIALLPTIVSKNNKILSLYLLFYIGEISYSIYLWHYILLQQYNYSKIMYYIAVMFLFSLLSYNLVEYPLKFIKKYKIEINIVVMAYGFLLYRLTFKKYKYKVITQPPLFSSNYNIIRNECLKNAIRHSTVSYCRNKKWYLLIGDSHLLVWSPLLYKLAKLKDVSLLYIWVTIKQLYISTYVTILIQLKNINTYTIDSIFISNNLNFLLNNGSKLQYNIIECLELFKIISNHTYFIEDIPFLKFNPHNYVTKKINNYKFNINPKECIYYEYNILQNYLKYKYLSFIDIICPNCTCILLDGNILMYVDNNHLSFEFTDKMKDKLLKKIKDIFDITNIGKVKLLKKEFHLYYINNSINCG